MSVSRTDPADDSISGLEPLQSINLTHTIQKKLLQFIRARGLMSGDRLPSESRLVRSLNVSRVTVREALKSMEALGIVRARAGSGWYVQEASYPPQVQALGLRLEQDAETLASLMEVRVRLEASYVSDVMAGLTMADLGELDRLVCAMEERSARGEPFEEQDQRFHELLFAGLGNRVFRELSDLFWRYYRDLCLLVWEGDDYFPEHLRIEASIHRRILNALRAGDAPQARAALWSSYEETRVRLAQEICRMQTR
jgi:DNA-binding FadR family transcriptional regulator